MFTSRLSVNEFVLSDTLKILGSVSGTYVFNKDKLGFSVTGQSAKSLTTRRQKILSSAFARLAESAAALGANGVIGVQITHQQLGNSVWEFTVSGTAVRGDAFEKVKRPCLCTLSGQECWTLLRSGYRPVGVAYGVSVYFQNCHQRVEQKVAQKRNTERSDFTRGLYTARKNAFAALHKEAAKFQAEGVLSIQITSEKILHRELGVTQGMLVEFTALGTAVVASEKYNLEIGYAQTLTD